MRLARARRHGRRRRGRRDRPDRGRRGGRGGRLGRRRDRDRMTVPDGHLDADGRGARRGRGRRRRHRRRDRRRGRHRSGARRGGSARRRGGIHRIGLGVERTAAVGVPGRVTRRVGRLRGLRGGPGSGRRLMLGASHGLGAVMRARGGRCAVSGRPPDGRADLVTDRRRRGPLRGGRDAGDAPCDGARRRGDGEDLARGAAGDRRARPAAKGDDRARGGEYQRRAERQRTGGSDTCKICPSRTHCSFDRQAGGELEARIRNVSLRT